MQYVCDCGETFHLILEGISIFLNWLDVFLELFPLTCNLIQTLFNRIGGIRRRSCDNHHNAGLCDGLCTCTTRKYKSNKSSLMSSAGSGRLKSHLLVL